MNEKQYLQLIRAAACIKTKIETGSQQLSEFKGKCISHCTQTANQLDRIQQAIDGKTNPEIVKSYLAEVAKIRQQFKKSIERQVLDFQKDLGKTEQEIYSKILPKLDKDLNPENFDFSVIRKPLDAAKPIIDQMKATLATCFAQMTLVQGKLASCESKLEDLDLPHAVAKTSKQVALLTAQLDSLKLKLSAMDSADDKSEDKDASLSLSFKP